MDEGFRSNGEYLEAVLTLVDSYLDGAGAENTRAERKELTAALRKCCELTMDQGGVTALEYLFRTFGLTDFEQFAVAAALAPELDQRYGERYAALRENKGRLPTLELCLSSYTDNWDERLSLLSQWRQHREQLDFFFQSSGLNGLSDGSDLCADLKLHRRILDFTLDYTSEDESLEGICRLYWPTEQPKLVLYQKLLEQMEDFSHRKSQTGPVLFYLKGERGSGRRTLARRFCAQRRQPLLVVDISALIDRDGSWMELLMPVFREARIRNAALAFTEFDVLQGRRRGDLPMDGSSAKKGAEQPEEGWGHIRYLLEHAAKITGQLFLCSSVSWQPGTPEGPWIRAELELGMPDTAQRLALWQHETEKFSLSHEVNLDSLAGKFALLPGQIAAAAADALRLRDWADREQVDSEMLHRACRAQLPHDLGKLASRVNASYTWDDLILPPEQKERLKAACDQVEYRQKVYDQWGFGKKVAYGRGVSMLFSGPPGTGKTMAAQVIANRLGLELYKVDLSGVMSKYVGETEKQLGAVFDEVKKSQSILFFDEADALFGKRSETRDSHDRYANVQTSYLLQKIEDYDGIVILASNFLQNFDEAFKRRIKFIIDFTLPDQDRREQIWRSVMPPELPKSEDVDFDFMSRSFELSGSSIKNISVAAAFLAAAEDECVDMPQLLLATQAEQHKAGKSMSREEFGEYYHQVERYRIRKQQDEGHSGA